MTALHDAARQAALDERDRLQLDATDYQIGRIVEAALAVIEGRPPMPEPCVIDCDGWDELPFDDDEPRHRAIDVSDPRGLL